MTRSKSDLKETQKTKLMYLDLETTGLNPIKNGIIQISGIIEIDGKIKEDFNFMIRPFDNDWINDSTMEFLNIEKSDLFSDERIGPEETYKVFMEIIDEYINKKDSKDKFFFVGFNCEHFDNNFMRNFFRKNENYNYNYYFWNPTIDMYNLWAGLLHKKRRHMENFKLITVAREIGIDVDEKKLHNAEYDIKITRLMYKKYIERIENAKSNNSRINNEGYRKNDGEGQRTIRKQRRTDGNRK